MAAPRVFNAYDPNQETYIDERNLPHWFQPGATCFMTFRTADSLPQSVFDQWIDEQLDWLARVEIRLHRTVLLNGGEKLRARVPDQHWPSFQKVRYRRLNHHLDRGHGECLLRRPGLSAIVADALKFFERDRYDSDSFVIMPNHAHILFQPRGHWKPRRLHASWTRFTARKINCILARSGAFWHPEPFDHLVRSEGQFRYLRTYIRQNPGKAGLSPCDYYYWTWAG